MSLKTAIAAGCTSGISVPDRTAAASAAAAVAAGSSNTAGVDDTFL